MADRKQQVRIATDLSGEVNCISGIGQGSILGPQLFTVYVDGVFKVTLSDGAGLILYADDCLYIKPLVSAGAVTSVQIDISALVDHFASFHLHVNPAKSKLLIVSPNEYTSPVPLIIDDTPILPLYTYSVKLKSLEFQRKFNFEVCGCYCEKGIEVVGCTCGKYPLYLALHSIDMQYYGI